MDKNTVKKAASFVSEKAKDEIKDTYYYAAGMAGRMMGKINATIERKKQARKDRIDDVETAIAEGKARCRAASQAYKTASTKDKPKGILKKLQDTILVSKRAFEHKFEDGQTVEAYAGSQPADAKDGEKPKSKFQENVEKAENQIEKKASRALSSIGNAAARKGIGYVEKTLTSGLHGPNPR